MGRAKAKLTKRQQEEVLQKYKNGMSKQQLANVYSCSLNSVVEATKGYFKRRRNLTEEDRTKLHEEIQWMYLTGKYSQEDIRKCLSISMVIVRQALKGMPRKKRTGKVVEEKLNTEQKTQVYECKTCGQWKRKEYTQDFMCCNAKMKLTTKTLKPILSFKEQVYCMMSTFGGNYESGTNTNIHHS